MNILLFLCVVLVSVILLFEAPLLVFVLISGFVVYINSMDILDIMAYACFVFVSTFVVCLLSFIIFDYERFKRRNSDRNEKKLSHDDIYTVKAVFISSLFTVHIVMLYVNLIVYLDIQNLIFFLFFFLFSMVNWIVLYIF